RVSDGIEPRVDLLEQPAVRLRELTRLRDCPETAIDRGQRPVHEVSPVRDELVVISTHELRPREVAVLRLGPGCGEEVAKRIGVVAAEEIADFDRDSTAD